MFTGIIRNELFLIEFVNDMQNHMFWLISKLLSCLLCSLLIGALLTFFFVYSDAWMSIHKKDYKIPIMEFLIIISNPNEVGNSFISIFYFYPILLCFSLLTIVEFHFIFYKLVEVHRTLFYGLLIYELTEILAIHVFAFHCFKIKYLLKLKYN